jgi:hypothetical protein
MKTSALTLQHHLTNCMRLFAVTAILLLADTASGQVADSLHKAKPDKRWGIGVMVGTPDRTISSNIDPSPEGYVKTGYFQKGNRYSFSYGICLYKYINRNKLRLNFNNTIYKAVGESTFDFINSGGGYSHDEYLSKIYYYNISLGYEVVNKINRLELNIFSGLSSFFYSKGLHTINRQEKTALNSPYKTTLYTNKFDLGYSVGICINPSINYRISKHIVVGTNANINLLYGSTNNYSRKSIIIETSEITQDINTGYNYKGFFISPTCYININYEFN